MKRARDQLEDGRRVSLNKQVSLSAAESFRVQVSLLHHTAPSVRLRALACLHAQFDLLTSTQGLSDSFISRALHDRLWKEENPHVAQQIVKALVALELCGSTEEHRPAGRGHEHSSNLARLGTTSIAIDTVKVTCQVCEQSALEKNGSRRFGRCLKITESATWLSKTLLDYLSRICSLSDCCQSLGLKLQTLRSLRKLTEETGAVEMMELLNLLRSVDLLNSSDPFIRAETLLLAAMVLVSNSAAKVVQSHSSGKYGVDLFQEFTCDSSAIVRKAAISSLFLVGSNGITLTRGSYAAVCALFEDSNDTIRSLAVQVVHLWVKQEVEHQLNDEFVKVCRMMIDMDMFVRMEACKALSSIRKVREELLFQALSKKPLGELAAAKKGKKLFSVITISETDMDISTMDRGMSFLDNFNMGALVHGIEDEFWEVRSLAVQCLARLSNCSDTARENIVELLIDMLNDDAKHVRLSSLHGLYHVAHKWGLVVKDNHLQTVLTNLVDASEEIRGLGRKLLAEMKFSTADQFNCTIKSLMNSMQTYPDEEGGVQHALCKLGTAQSSYVQLLTEDLTRELKAYLSGNAAGLDAPRCGCILTLIVAASACDSSMLLNLPMQLSKRQESVLNWRALGKLPSEMCTSLNNLVEATTMTHVNLCPVLSSTEYNGMERIKDFVNATMKRAYDLKGLLEHNMFNLMLQGLSVCRKDLRFLLGKVTEVQPTSIIKFASYFIECLDLLSQGWITLHLKRKKIQVLTTLSYKLEFVIRCMQHAFVGHTVEQQFQLLELSILPAVWRIASSAGDAKRDHNQLISTLDSIDTIMKHGCGGSSFITDVKNKLLSTETSLDLLEKCNVACELASSFWPIHTVISNNELLEELKAELNVPGNDFEHPLFFTPGLPLGITIVVRLTPTSYTRNCRMWVQFQINDTACTRLYRFVDIEDRASLSTTLGHGLLPDGIRKCALKASLMLECLDFARDEANQVPKGFLLPLTPQKVIHLMSVHSIEK